MKNKKIFKNLIIIGIGLIGLVSTLLINNSVENDLLCILIMALFLALEIYGLSNIIKDKYSFR